MGTSSDLSTTSQEQLGWPNISEFVEEVVDGASGVTMTELCNDQSPGGFSCRSNTASAAALTFATDAANIHDGSVVGPMIKSILGGWFRNHKVSPMKHPYLTALRATDIAIQLVAPASGDSQGNDGDYQTYQRALLAVEFRSLPYSTDTGKNDWITISRQASNQRISTPAGFYVFQGGSDAVQDGTFITEGIEYVNVHIYQVSQDTLFNGNNFGSFLEDFIGQVNNALFLGRPAGQVLLDSASIGEPYGDYTEIAAHDSRIYEPVLHFLVNRDGWQTGLKSDGTFVNIVSKNGGNPPFTAVDLTAVMKRLEPTWSES